MAMEEEMERKKEAFACNQTVTGFMA